VSLIPTFILRSKPENCCKKIKKRNRTSEKNITHEYIKMLHDIHEETFENYDTIVPHVMITCKMICIDVDGKTVVEVANEILEIIQTHFPSHKYIPNTQIHIKIKNDYL
jgi:deoxyadenosine/deoxycytidine kinase